MAATDPRSAASSTSWVFPAVLGLLVALAMTRQGGPVFDDPFILYRYAQNLADGNGWQFNPVAESANAVTSVLSVLSLAAFEVLGFHIPAAASLVHLLAIWGAAVLTAAALSTIGLRHASYVAGVLIATSPAFTAYWGMESSWVLFLLSSTIYLGASNRRLRWSALALAAMVLARPDSILVGGLVVVAWYGPWTSRWPDRRELAVSAAAFAAPLLAWAVVAEVFIGSALPSTLEAKQAQADSGRWALFASRTSLTAVARSLSWPLALVLVVGAVVGLLWSLRRRRALEITLPLAIAGLLLVVAYGFVLGIASYPWYYATSVYGVIVLAAVGLGWLISLLAGDPRRATAAVVATCAVLGVAGLAATQTEPSTSRQRYPFVGDWLRQHTEETATVASIEIGALGWYSERDMVDYLGLLDPDDNDEITEGDFSSWLAEEQPDYWVTTGRWIDASAYESPCREHFEVVHRDGPLEVLRRTGPIPGDEACVRPGGDRSEDAAAENPANP